MNLIERALRSAAPPPPAPLSPEPLVNQRRRLHAEALGRVALLKALADELRADAKELAQDVERKVRSRIAAAVTLSDVRDVATWWGEQRLAIERAWNLATENQPALLAFAEHDVVVARNELDHAEQQAQSVLIRARRAKADRDQAQKAIAAPYLFRTGGDWPAQLRNAERQLAELAPEIARLTSERP